MIFNFWLAVGITGGAIVGFGLFLLAVQFVPATPALGPALRRLHPTTPEPSMPALARATHNADLEILGRTQEQHIMSIVLSAGLALVLPVLLTILAFILGIRLPFTIPLAVTLLASAGAALLAHRDMRVKARTARAEFARALCTYAALTAHQVRSGHGAVEAMERSASICNGWPYTRLRTALLTAQLQMRPPWDELKSLAAEIDVVELASFADIMRSAGSDGAQVYQTLRAQASSLRDQIRVRALETAKTRTSKLDVPSTMLIIVLLVLIGYPLMASLFNNR
ncbi:MAG TPA: secretion system protein [Micromonosporaceae bacterium]|nr:secretion system protein [Micromonosporaceae bacterium]